MLQLQALFVMPTGRLKVKTIAGVIAQAFDEGDDPEWIEEIVSQPAT